MMISFSFLEFTYQTKDAATGAALSLSKRHMLWHIGVSFPELGQKHSFSHPGPVDLLPYPPPKA